MLGISNEYKITELIADNEHQYMFISEKLGYKDQNMVALL